MIICKGCMRSVDKCECADRAALFVDVVGPVKTKLQKEFESFHTNNPHVYVLFKKYTFEAINRGFQHYSSDAVLHRIRWHTSVETDDPEGFKINNNHTAYYARMFMAEFPRYTGFFRNRKVKGAA